MDLAAYYLIFMFLGVYGTILVPWMFHMPVHARFWAMTLQTAIYYVLAGLAARAENWYLAQKACR